MQFMYAITPIQSKVARTYLSWSQADLAAASHVSLSTVSSFENGLSPRASSIKQIREALENAGIEFTEGEGVKRQDSEARLYRGFGSCEAFYNDVLVTAQKEGGDIFCIVKSQSVLAHIFGITNFDQLQPLELLSDVANVKCLLSGTPDQSFDIPKLQFRLTSDYNAAPSCYIGYGNKYAHIVQESRESFIFSVFKIPQAAQGYRVYFVSLWNNALELRGQSQSQIRRTANTARR